MKYKVGDKVRVRKDLNGHTKYYSEDKKRWDDATSEMIRMAGRIVTINEVFDGKYSIKECKWNWTDEMFEDLLKFKIGDRVKAISSSSKPCAVGKVGVIKKIDKFSSDLYGIEFDEYIDGHNLGGTGKRGHCWWCRNDELELADNSKIVITTDGTTTTAKLYEGKKFVKSAEAKCSPDDKFDFNLGATIALSRLTGLELKAAEEKPKFTKSDLKTGMFVLMHTDDWGVIVNDKIVYRDYGYDLVDTLNEDLCLVFNRIEAVVEAKSFRDAKRCFECGKNVLYRRNNK